MSEDDMSEDELTREEKRWFARLKRVLKDMPPDVYVMVHTSSIALVRNTAREAAFLRDGHFDQVLDLDWFVTDRVQPCGESL